MTDEDKTKEQLICELVELRQRIAELETQEAENRRMLEEALRKSEQEERAILDSMSEFVVRQDAEMKILWTNKAIGEWCGLAPEQMIGRHCYDLWHHRSEPCAGCPVKKALETGEPQRAEIISSGGILLIRGYPLRDEDGVIVGVVEVASDVTESKQAEKALANEKERLAVTLRSIGDGVIATDMEGKIVLINKVAEKLTGWTEEEALGRSLEQVFHIVNEDTRERCKNPVEKVMESGGMVDLADDLASDVVLLTRDGKERVIADSGGPIRDKDGRIIGVILVFRDITEEREIEEELVKIQKLESIGVLAGGIAHDFNNILTGILGNISLARIYTDPHKVSERLVEAEKASIRARELTQRLLTFSKGGAPIMKTASIAELLRESAAFASSGSNVKCAFFIADDLWPVEIDEGQMNQVINNLIVNAEQAMPEGGTIKVRAENVDVGPESILPIKEGEYVRISIEDHGIGIPKEHLRKIFDPYFTTKQKGSGLGLATSYSIVRNHSGYITAESQVGVGATFYVYIPASPEGILATEKKEIEKLAMGRRRILVMDDEDIVREFISDVLNTIGYETVVAREGAEAIELYEEAMRSDLPFDLVIMDLTIPGGMGGKEAVQKLIKLDPKAKVIASSGYSNDPVMSDFRKYSFVGAIAKPYRINELRNILDQAMSGVEQVSSSDYS